MKVTKEIFKQHTGKEPIQDDLERSNCCLFGEVGHSSCGWCNILNRPRFMGTCDLKGIHSECGTYSKTN